jgi:hypothetical protein
LNNSSQENSSFGISESDNEAKTSGPKRVIKSVHEITEWFDVRKYDGLKSLDLVGWAKQVTSRSFTHWLLTDHLLRYESLDDPRQIEILKDQKNHALNWIRSFVRDPIVPPFKDDEKIGIWRNGSASRPYDGHTIRAMTASNVYFLSLERDSESPYWQAVFSAGDAENYGRTTPEQDKILKTPADLIYKKKGIDTDGLTFVEVDLKATDEQIMSDFRHWLTNYRQVVDTPAPQQNFTDKDFSAWFEAGVIPYIDLMLWSLAGNCSITQNVLGQVIFPDEYSADTTERIRRTTRPKAERMLRQDFARAIEIQADVELIAQKKPTLESVQLMSVPK